LRNTTSQILATAWVLAAGLAGCYGSTANPPASPGVSAPPTILPTATPAPTPTPSPTAVPTGPTPTPTAQPQLVHIGFELKEHTDPKYGPVYYYSPTLDNQANVVFVKAGSTLQFINDSPASLATQHTASGLGSKGFPSMFDNTSAFTQAGTAVDSSLTWSTGTLNPGQTSQVFTVSKRGVYYFGCAYHYFQPPTVSNGSMGDVIVAM
jgi:plastocyanin